MTLGDILREDVDRTFRETWSSRDGRVVPETADLTLGNDGITLQATVLYADMSDSTGLVTSRSPQFSAEVFKVFLNCAAKIITAHGGVITAYDGDRVMAVFIGNTKNTNSVVAALKLHYAVSHIINPAIGIRYPKVTYRLRHVVGIDTGKVLVARTGVRGANDLVWVGRAANHAAKLAAFSPEHPTWITAEVYNLLLDRARLAGSVNMWEARTWTSTDRTIYRSTYHWAI